MYFLSSARQSCGVAWSFPPMHGPRLQAPRYFDPENVNDNFRHILAVLWRSVWASAQNHGDLCDPRLSTAWFIAPAANNVRGMAGFLITHSVLDQNC